MQTLLSAASGSGAQIREDLDSGVFDRFKSLPMAHIAPLAGQLFADVLRLVIATAVSFLTGYLMGWRSSANIWWDLGAAVLAIFSSWAISWVFSLLGLMAKSATLVQSFSMMAMMVLSFLSNAFIPIKTLPDWLQTVANANPITYVIKAITGMMNSGVWNNEAWLVLVISIGIVIVFAPLTVWAYNHKN